MSRVRPTPSTLTLGAWRDNRYSAIHTVPSAAARLSQTYDVTAHMSSSQPCSRYSRLAPLSLEQRVQVSLEALNFFSPMSYEKVCAVIDRPQTPGRTEPLDGGEFIKYLERSGVLPESSRYTTRIRDLLSQLEAAGLLTAMGQGRDALIGKRYYFLKELTTLERKGVLWISKALGAQFIHNAFASVTFQITGADEAGDIHAGTALAVGPNWLLTCAHVLTDMRVHEEQYLAGRLHRVLRTTHHPSIDVGLIFIEPTVEVLPALAFRDPELSETLFTFGYPRVPLARAPALVMQRGEVTSTEVTLLDGSRVFLYSAVARPDNSGGPILSASGHVLGIVTEELADEARRPTLPFHAGVAASTISAALAEIEPAVLLPFENYD